ncbi:MAG: hypothetical protein AB2784_21830 [Candidatus Thiodiazotropha endolucinida]
MDTGYFVTQRKQCGTCHGKGKLFDPTGLHQAFGEFIRELEERTGLTSPELDNENEGKQFEWWHQHGYEVDSWETFNTNTPPEEVICPDCRGDRIIAQEVRLDVALGHLGVAQQI